MWEDDYGDGQNYSLTNWNFTKKISYQKKLLTLTLSLCGTRMAESIVKTFIMMR